MEGRTGSEERPVAHLMSGSGPFVAAPGRPLSKNISDYPDGVVLVVDKPWRWTSADVIRKIKYAAIRHFCKKNLKVPHRSSFSPAEVSITS